MMWWGGCGCCGHLWCCVCGCLWWLGYLVRVGHGRVLWFGVLCVRGGCGFVLQLTFKTSYSIYAVDLSSHIVHSGISPVPCPFFIVIMSPLSSICNPQRLAYLYTSALFMYLVADRN